MTGPLSDGGRLPWLFEAAARLESEPIRGMYTDAGVVTRSLAGAAALFDLPAVASSFDTTVEAEAAGCSIAWENDRPVVTDGCVETVDDAFSLDTEIGERGRVPTVANATRRLAETTDVPVFAGVTGPAALTEHLLVGGPDDHDDAVVEETLFTAADLSLSVMNACLGDGAHGVVLLEPAGIAGFDLYPEAAAPLANVADHYQAGVAVATERAGEGDLRCALDVGFDAVTGVFGNPSAIRREFGDEDVRAGIGVPDDVLLDGAGSVAEFLDGLAGDGDPLVSSEFTVPPDTRPEVLHELCGSLG